MKKVMTIFGAILFASFILTGCGNESKSKDPKLDSKGLKGKYFKKLDGRTAIYFISDNELIYSYGSDDGSVSSYKYKYSTQENEITVYDKDKADATSSNTKYVVYNNEVLMYFWDGKWDYPRGVSYRLSE